ncbi:transcriptional regulator, partial [Streptomyces sp. NPDC046316]
RGEALRGSAAPCGGLEDAMAVLAARGYEPHMEGGAEGVIGEAGAEGAIEEAGAAAVAGQAGEVAPVVRMRNCPFHAVAERFPPLVCGMNLALLEGLLGTDGPVRARMDARPGECCVVVESSKTNDD